MTATLAKAPKGDAAGYAGRFGLAARGVIYLLVSTLAMQMAFGRNDESADRKGALRSIADNGPGRVLLVVLTFGFTAYALWRSAEALGRKDGVAKRIAAAGKAVLYASAAATAASTFLDIGSRGGDSNEQSRSLTASVLSVPGGRVLVVVAGLVAIGVGAWLFWRGVTRRFEKHLKLVEMSRPVERTVRVLGIVGHSARGVIATLVGLLLLRAAADHDARQAQGVDGTLRTIADRPYGAGLLLLTALGLAAVGLHSFAEARYRRT